MTKDQDDEHYPWALRISLVRRKTHILAKPPLTRAIQERSGIKLCKNRSNPLERKYARMAINDRSGIMGSRI
jgi:hypothetical protein